jgi:tRNA-Thr(GGU) m(6)t(6)A37 methyltransferase TsaA
MTNQYNIKSIGKVISAYKTKFGAPRQSGMVRSDRTKLVFDKDIALSSFKPLKVGNFIWILFIFDQCDGNEKLHVRPPRLGGNEKIGVFATRSPFRPNNIGMSLGRIEEMNSETDSVSILVSGLDLADQTPIIDIKPYHPIADCAWSESEYWFGEGTVNDLEVKFPQALTLCEEDKGFIRDVLAKDPRPAYHDDENRVYTIELLSFEIKFKVNDNIVDVLGVTKV